MNNDLQNAGVQLSNGFILRIKNQNDSEVDVPLFLGQKLPDGVNVTTIDGAYNYDALFNIARLKQFEGIMISSSYDGVLELVIINAIKKDRILLKYRSDNGKFLINGIDQYFIIKCPANSSFNFTLYS